MNMRIRELGLMAAGLVLAATLAPLRAQAPAPVVIEGVVPDEATRATLLTSLRELYGADRVVDRLRIDNVVALPNWAGNIAKLASQELRQVSPGQLDVNGNNVRISGQVANETQRQNVLNHVLTSLNSTYTVNGSGLRVGGSPQLLIDEILVNRIVEFESGSATLTPVGLAVLGELLEPMRQLGDSRVEIIGHTDNVGRLGANVALSRARAETVRAYFRQNGIPDGAMSVSGAGPDQPVADNGSIEGRARNRRIEFRVRDPR
ncbi:MAG: OmpA family protein [Xanthomonadaceae bacterium]|jgi:OOP family OmpA-OmpF porin|nr:OmpA family protein [Xanthomonadaceae bacterium]